MIEEKYVVMLAIQYAISFFVLGAIWQSWRCEDKEQGREPFWVIKHYWRKVRKVQSNVKVRGRPTDELETEKKA